MTTQETMPVFVAAPAEALPSIPVPDKTLDRIGYLSGLLFVGVFQIYGFKVPGPPTEFDNKILADFYRANEVNVVEGVYVATIAFLLFFVFVASISNLARRADQTNGWLPSVIFGSGAMAVTIFLLGQASLTAVALMAGRNTNPDIIRGMDEISHIITHFFAAPLGVFLTSTAVAIRQYGIMPRWLSIPSFASGITLLITCGTFNHVLPMHGIGVLALVVFLVTVLLMSSTLLWKTR